MDRLAFQFRSAADRSARCRGVAADAGHRHHPGALLARDNALDLDLTLLLYPVWQTGVAVGLGAALGRNKLA
jgi:hypothetical protein